MESKLLDLLEDGKKRFQQLIQLAEEKKAAIVENKRELIAELSQKELELAEALEGWELAREELAAGKTLRELAESAQGGEKLHKLREELVELTEKLASLNQQNAQLLRTSLAYTEYALSLLQTESQTYGQQERSKPSVLDRTV